MAIPGLMQLLPIRVDTPLQVTSEVAGFGPSGVVTVLGLRGTTSDGMKQLVLAYESPVSRQTVPPGGLGHEEVETLHLGQYQSDLMAATGSAYRAVQRGPNPPDFTGSESGGAIGIECTSFAIQERRGVNGLFEIVRAAVLREGSGAFSRLRGAMVYMWFGAGATLLPPSILQRNRVSEVVDALSAYVPDFSRLVVPYGDPPPQAPQLPLSQTPTGCEFYAVPLAAAMHASPFYDEMGFEMGVAYTTRHSTGSGWTEMNRVITGHDKPGVEHLLLTAGGPDARGFSFISEEVLLDMLLEDTPRVAPLSFIERVILHFWSSGRIVQLAPEDGGNLHSRQISPGRAGQRLDQELIREDGRAVGTS